MLNLNLLLTRCMFALLLTAPLAGCDQIMEVLNKQQANGKAIGAACRHSGRALEDCYRRNPKISKADIFSGWKEMNEYMLAKKLDIVPPPPDISLINKNQANIAEDGSAPDQNSQEAKSAKKTEKASAAKSE